MPGLRVVEPAAYFVRVPAETDMTNIILNFPRTAAARPAFNNSAVALKLLTEAAAPQFCSLRPRPAGSLIASAPTFQACGKRASCCFAKLAEQMRGYIES